MAMLAKTEKPGVTGILNSSGISLLNRVYHRLTYTVFNPKVLHKCMWQKSSRSKIDDELYSHNIRSKVCVLDI